MLVTKYSISQYFDHECVCVCVSVCVSNSDGLYDEARETNIIINLVKYIFFKVSSLLIILYENL